MALDQIWKQQLALVSYGNEYLNHDLSFSGWKQHSIFTRHTLYFRDLITQHLLAQHFQVWLEGLKQQGVYRISLHASNLLVDEKNPNPNVELLSSHVLVTHSKTQKTAWIMGQELAEWYLSDQAFEIPLNQRSDTRETTFWRYDLSDKLAKKVQADLETANWKDISAFLSRELFEQRLAQGVDLESNGKPFYGTDTLASSEATGQYLPLLPSEYPAQLAHELLHKVERLSHFIQQKRQHPYHATGEMFSPEEQIALRQFAEKIEDMHAKLIVRVANHYQSAHPLPAAPVASPLEPQLAHTPTAQIANSTPQHSHKVGSSSVIKLVLLTIIICACAYYFGL
ncbi:hypothetical protein ABW55_05890 [Acinetobacter sp. C15]|uniref:hypothetical protein n=1 Tax=unclassified Acinetobacter TaxID=196816 RepID=UPI00065F988B|nr:MULTISPECIES: hypothetical protein [unclassified Acinetobacter]KOR16063.1 hypothetical protein ABW55_05890 [Acinetobacter sp. C15]